MTDEFNMGQEQQRCVTFLRMCSEHAVTGLEARSLKHFPGEPVSTKAP